MVGNDISSRVGASLANALKLVLNAVGLIKSDVDMKNDKTRARERMEEDEERPNVK